MIPTVDTASELHRTGRLAEAEAAYRVLLANNPNDATVILALGQLRAQRGNLVEGLNLIDRALRLDPKMAMAHFHFGGILVEMGRHQEALASFAAALTLQPDLADAHFARGCVLFGLRKIEDAARAFENAAAAAPGNIEALLNLGSMLLELKRYEEALSACESALAVSPGHPGALNNRGNTLRLMGRMEAALADFDQVIAADPRHALARFNRATVLDALRRSEAALAECDRALALAPNDASAHHLRGTILLNLNEPADALTSFERASALQPALAAAHHGRISALIKLTRWEEALSACDTIIEGEQASAIAHNNRGVALLKLRRYEEARREFEHAIALEPSGAKGYFNRSGLYYELNRLEEAFADAQRAVELEPDFVAARNFRFSLAARLCDWRGRTADIADIIRCTQAGEEVDPFLLLYAVDDPELHLAAARKAAGKSEGRLTRTTAAARTRLRIAFLSPDFGEHPVSHQAIELLELHDRERIETFGISLWPHPQGRESERIRQAFSRFVEAFDRTDQQIARRIADLEIDIAVDLGGYTDKARTHVLAWRPAPISAAYLGYPGTLGADFVDYLIADGCTVPEQDERFYAEKIVRLSGCYMPHDSTIGPAPARPSRMDEGLPAKGLVFANFNKTDKFVPEVFDIWMRILRTIPDSVLWLSVPNPTARANLIAEAQARCVAQERLVFAGRRADRSQHLARLTLADLFLDTFPYNAHATTSDFLAAGVPVLTCTGHSFASRVAKSLLKSVWLPELIATGLQDYEALAVRLATDRKHLSDLQRKVRRRTAEDSRRLARHLEEAYFTMWDRHVRGLKPQSFTVK